MKSRLRIAASSVALSMAGLLAAGIAKATTFNITWTSDQPTAVGGASFTGTVNSQDPAIPLLDLYPNDRSLLPPLTPDLVYAWCIQPDEFQDIGSAWTGTWELRELSNAPIQSPGTVMGADSADAMRWLVGTLNPDLNSVINDGSSEQGDLRAAFQLALWEIAYERADKWDVLSGSFDETWPYVIDPTAAVAQLANTWLDTIESIVIQKNSAPSSWFYAEDIYALSNYEGSTQYQYPVRQDFVVRIDGGGDTSEVPLPSAVWLFGSAMAGIVAVARRRRRPAAA